MCRLFARCDKSENFSATDDAKVALAGGKQVGNNQRRVGMEEKFEKTLKKPGVWATAERVRSKADLRLWWLNRSCPGDESAENCGDNTWGIEYDAKKDKRYTSCKDISADLPSNRSATGSASSDANTKPDAIDEENIDEELASGDTAPKSVLADEHHCFRKCREENQKEADSCPFATFEVSDLGEKTQKSSCKFYKSCANPKAPVGGRDHSHIWDPKKYVVSWRNYSMNDNYDPTMQKLAGGLQFENELIRRKFSNGNIDREFSDHMMKLRSKREAVEQTLDYKAHGLEEEGQIIASHVKRSLDRIVEGTLKSNMEIAKQDFESKEVIVNMTKDESDYRELDKKVDAEDVKSVIDAIDKY